MTSPSAFLSWPRVYDREVEKTSQTDLRALESTAVKVPSEIGQLVVEELHHMKMIEDDGGPKKVRQYGTHADGGHSDGDGLHLCRRMAQPFPESLECICSLAVADEYDGTAFEIEDDGDVLVSFLHDWSAPFIVPPSELIFP